MQAEDDLGKCVRYNCCSYHLRGVVMFLYVMINLGLLANEQGFKRVVSETDGKIGRVNPWDRAWQPGDFRDDLWLLQGLAWCPSSLGS